MRFAGRRSRSPGHLTVEQALTVLLERVAESPDVDDWALVDALVSRGTTQIIAMRFVVFAPIAFGREHLSGRGVTFNDTFEVRGKKSRTKKPLPLTSSPEFMVSRQAAARLDPASPSFRALALRSPEVVVATELQNNGSMEGVVCTPVLTLWDIL